TGEDHLFLRGGRQLRDDEQRRYQPPDSDERRQLAELHGGSPPGGDSLKVSAMFRPATGTINGHELPVKAGKSASDHVPSDRRGSKVSKRYEASAAASAVASNPPGSLTGYEPASATASQRLCHTRGGNRRIRRFRAGLAPAKLVRARLLCSHQPAADRRGGRTEDNQYAGTDGLPGADPAQPDLRDHEGVGEAALPLGGRTGQASRDPGSLTPLGKR